MKIKRVSTGFNLDKTLKDIQKRSLTVGFHPSAVYEDGKSVAMIAVQNEFGNVNKNIPPRPFMRPTVSENKEKWKNIIFKQSKAITNNQLTPKSAFVQLGELVGSNIQSGIVNVTAPALATATVMNRLRGKKQGKSVSLSIAKPLIDSGYMLNSVTAEVK